MLLHTKLKIKIFVYLILQTKYFCYTFGSIDKFALACFLSNIILNLLILLNCFKVVNQFIFNFVKNIFDGPTIKPKDLSNLKLGRSGCIIKTTFEL